MPVKSYYHSKVEDFLLTSDEQVLAALASSHHFKLEGEQRWAWEEQLKILRKSLSSFTNAHLFLEFYIPRMGKRADAVLLTKNVVFVIEFKVGASDYSAYASEQVQDYALDLKNFHEGSHLTAIVPVLVSSNALSSKLSAPSFDHDLVARPLVANAEGLVQLISYVCNSSSFPTINQDEWMAKGYKPTPTIIEAAQTLYETHSVVDISRSDASARNLQQTSASVSAAIDRARNDKKKVICFVTGVPGSGKTLAGLNIATVRADEHKDEHAVFLSGNGPLVDVLREALARDKAQRESVSKKDAEREVRSFIQNIHHFRDDYVGNKDVPAEKVVVFDEAQRAWTRQQAASFMQKKRGHSDFDMSEPEFLIGVMDRHKDWCAIVCLIGEGQEINTGEAGISEWIDALANKFPNWEIYSSPAIAATSSMANPANAALFASPRTFKDEDLHLSVSMRSFRAEKLSTMISAVVDSDLQAARSAYEGIKANYPICITRDLVCAKQWLRDKARGTERFGLVASSGANRLRPEGIFVKAEVDPPNWFLNDNADIRSSYYLEDVATEFLVQGLELDWVGVCWDGDFHHNGTEWVSQAFKGTKWQAVSDENRRKYLKNAYRVLLTRGRQGMVIFVPRGDEVDKTRPKSFYDGTYNFLLACGIEAI